MAKSREVILPLAALSLLALVLAGCTGPGVPEPSGGEVTTPPATFIPVPGSETPVAAANNQFAFEFFRHLAADPEYGEGNIFFSPFSLSSALAITCEGARGTTAEEIRSVFHFPDNRSLMRSGFFETISGINSRVNAYTLKTANALWAEKMYPFLPEYIQTAEDYYGARTTNLDFIRAPEESRQTINRWVEEQTEDKIRDLVPAGEIDSATRLVITNAIYFRGTWVREFDRNKTEEADFRAGDGQIVSVPMMQRTDENAIFGYMETEGFQALSLPYESGGGREISMLVILPKGESLSGVEQALDRQMYDGIRAGLGERQVKVYLPRFAMETKYFLPRVLSSMGMTRAFTPGADFSGMDGTGGLFIANIIHQAFVETNEEGTEAAAATAVILQKTALPAGDGVPVFRADHPFLFIIHDQETGNILFMGRVSNPGPA